MIASLAVLRRLDYITRLRTLLAFNDFKLDRIPFLQALIAIGLDRTVVHENIGAILSPDEPKTFGIVKPFHSTFQSSHLLFLRTYNGLWANRWTSLKPGVRPSTSDHSVLLAMPMLEIGPVDSCCTSIVRFQWDVVNVVNSKTRASSGFPGVRESHSFAGKQ